MPSQTHATDARTRVLHLISDAGPHPYFQLIGEHADRDSFDVRLATVGPEGPLHRDAARMGLPSIALGATGRAGYPLAVVRLARLLRRLRIDVIHTHLLDASFVGLLAGRVARTPASIFTAHHSHEVPLHGRRSLEAVDRLCVGPLSDAVIAPSGQMRDTLVRVHGVLPNKVRVIHHGFELERLHPERVSGDAVRSELELNGRFVLLSIGRVYWMKNQESLLRAFAEVAPEAPDTVLVLAGGGDSAPLRELTDVLGLGDRVRILPARSDVPEILAAADLFVHPALAESFGMVILEAMAMARPVVATPVGIAPDVVEDGITGVLAADGKAEALAAALRKALSARDRLPAMGEKARRRAQDFPADGMVAAYEALYRTLLVERARQRSAQE